MIVAVHRLEFLGRGQLRALFARLALLPLIRARYDYFRFLLGWRGRRSDMEFETWDLGLLRVLFSALTILADKVEVVLFGICLRNA